MIGPGNTGQATASWGYLRLMSILLCKMYITVSYAVLKAKFRSISRHLPENVSSCNSFWKFSSPSSVILCSTLWFLSIVMISSSSTSSVASPSLLISSTKSLLSSSLSTRTNIYRLLLKNLFSWRVYRKILVK